jgi:hypothetical protein
MQTPLAAERRARWAVAAIFLANGAIMGAWASHIPVVEERLGISHATLGVALLCMAAGALVAMPAGGGFISRLGSATVTRASTLALLLAFSLPMLAPDAPLLALALIVFGGSNGVMDVAMNAHAVMVEKRLGRPVMSSFHGMFSLGGLAGAGFSGLLLTLVPPYSAALAMIAAAAALALPALLFLLPAHSDGGNGGPAFALPSKAALGIGALCFLALLAEGAVLDWSALHLKGSLDLGAGAAAMGFAAYSATMAGGRFLGDWLRGHIGAVVLVRGSAFLAAAGLSVAIALPHPLAAVAGYALVGLGLSNLVPIFFGAGGNIPGQAAGPGVAAVATMGYTGFLAGPPLIGFAAHAASLPVALGLVVAGCVLIGLAAIAAAPAERRAAPAAA